MTAKTARDLDLTLTGDQIDAIPAEARQSAEQAAAALAEAEAALTGEQGPGSTLKAADITPARLAELRAEAEHAALLVPAAQRRAVDIRAKQLDAHQAAMRAKVRTETTAADDDGTALIGKLETLQDAFTGFIAALNAHNERVTRWHAQMGEGGIPLAEDAQDSPDPGLTRTAEPPTITVDGNTWRHLPVGSFLGAVIHRTVRDLPPTSRHFRGEDLTGRDWEEGGISWRSPAYAVDLAKRVRESTGAA